MMPCSFLSDLLSSLISCCLWAIVVFRRQDSFGVSFRRPLPVR